MENTNSVIQVTRTETAPCCLSLKIEVPAGKSQQIYKQAVRDIGNQVKLPGFRTGKIPANVLLSHYGKEIKAEVQDRILNTCTREAVANIKPGLAVAPKLEGEAPEFKNGETYTYTVTVETIPSIKLPAYKGLKAERKNVAVTDDDVSGFIKGWLEQMAKYEKIERAAAREDLVKVTFKAECPAEVEATDAVKNVLEGANSWLFLREPERFPGVIAALEGMSAGETRDLTVEFPADYKEAALSGKTVNYHLELQEVHGKNVPGLNEEIFKRAGVKDEGELKDLARKTMEGQRKQAAEQAVTNDILAKLLDGQDFELPPTVLRQHVEGVLKEYWNHEVSRGAKPEEVRQRGKEVNDQATASATLTLRRIYLLGAIADAENIQVSNEEINGMLGYLSQMENKKPKELVRELQQNGRIYELIEELRMRKTIEHIVKLSDITDINE